MLCAGALLATAGCTAGDTPQRSATPTDSAPTDAAVLAAAIDAYTRYSAAFDVYLSDLPVAADSSGLKEAVTTRYWSVLEEEFRAEERAWYQKGSTAFGNAELLTTSIEGDTFTASIVVCVDSSHVELFDSEGAEVYAEDRVLSFPMQVNLEGASANRLRVDDSFSAEGDVQCEG